MERLTFSHIAWDTWVAGKLGSAAIAHRQRRRLRELVEFARVHSPYYADRYRDLPVSGVQDIRALPPVAKGDLLRCFDGWVTDREVTRAGVDAFVADKSLVGARFLGRYFVCTTSGTTGVPTILIHDAGMLALTSAVELARAVPAWGLSAADWIRFGQLGGRVAGTFVTGGHFQGVASMRRRHLENPRRRQTARMFSALAPLDEMVAGLNEYQPAVLAAYPSSLALLLEEQERGRLNIDPVLILPTGETLTAELRNALESIFRGHVRQSYGASEMPVIAYDCGRGGLHVNADWVVFEAVDEEYQPVPPGVPSRRVLLTNLANRLQPLIRYEMGDSVVVSPEPCACGSPLPSIAVEGRNDEILRFRGPAGRLVAIMPMALWSVVKDTPGVFRFQAIQTGAEDLKVRLEPKSGALREQVIQSLLHNLRAYLELQGLQNVQIAFPAEPPVPHPVSGKFRHVWSEVIEPAVHPAIRVTEEWSLP